eukprot:6341283-Prymnesium_polylepis.1
MLYTTIFIQVRAAEHIPAALRASPSTTTPLLRAHPWLTLLGSHHLVQLATAFIHDFFWILFTIPPSVGFYFLWCAHLGAPRGRPGG